MQYTKEQLMEMPINLLRGINIASQEEEKLVQSVLNTRMVDMPVENPMTFSASVTDHLTPEKEAELQAKINARNESIKAQFTLMDEDEEQAQELIDDVVDEAVVEQTLEQLQGETKVRFCEFCESKGVRHMKNCTRPPKAE